MFLRGRKEESFVFEGVFVLCSSRTIAVHQARGARDVHAVPGQLEVREEGHQDDVPGQAGVRPVPRGEFSFMTNDASGLVRMRARAVRSGQVNFNVCRRF